SLHFFIHVAGGTPHNNENGSPATDLSCAFLTPIPQALILALCQERTLAIKAYWHPNQLTNWANGLIEGGVRGGDIRSTALWGFTYTSFSVQNLSPSQIFIPSSSFQQGLKDGRAKIRWSGKPAEVLGLGFTGLVGRYYDNQGQPTKYLKGAEAKAARGAQLLEKQKQEEDKFTSCNSRWSQNEGGEVWCDSGYPRLVQRPVDIALTGKISKRCVCLKEEELDQPGLEVYQGCDYLAKTCKV
ncbi:hypothetical protein Ancab_012841, partial [Ancistrocladus abbreviatus]